MVIPIIRGMLNSTKNDILEQHGGRDKITFEVFARMYVEKAGDYGICFEYAVHQALQSRDTSIHPVVSAVLEDFCKIKGEAESILFGIEKNGVANIIETARNSLTDESRVLVGKAGKPPFLKKHLNEIAKAFHSQKRREKIQDKLPQSISGLWKADLFVGAAGPDQWVAATLKTNRKQLAPAPGLRLGLYPDERRGEGPKRDEKNNLILCPLPYSGEFMELFGASFQIVAQIMAAKGKLPSRVALVYDDDMTVAKWLTDRAHFPVVDILEALEPVKQPGLLEEATAHDQMTTVGSAPSPEAGDDGTEAAAPIPEKV
jgi:hypothetical protein